MHNRVLYNEDSMGSNSITESERSHSTATSEEKEMSTDKLPLPPVEVAKTEQRPLQGKKIMLLVSYGVGVTVLLAACIVFGSIFYHIQLKNCTTVQPTATDGQHSDDARGIDNEKTAGTGYIKEVKTHYKTPNGRTVKETLKDDYGSEVETIYFTSDGPENGTVLALDYRRSMSSLYIPSSEHCYIIGGIHRNFTSPFENNNKSLNDSRRDEEIADGVNNTDRFYYHLALDYPMTDPSILPATIRTYCRDREIYWLENVKEDDEPVRGKRACVTSSVCVPVCRKCGWWRRGSCCTNHCVTSRICY